MNTAQKTIYRLHKEAHRLADRLANSSWDLGSALYESTQGRIDGIDYALEVLAEAFNEYDYLTSLDNK